MRKKEYRKSMKQRVLSVLLVVMMLAGTLSFLPQSTVKAASIPSIAYHAHVQDVGWQDWVRDGAMAGTVGSGKQMEALEISLTKGKQSMVKYRVHIPNSGWLGWTTSGKMAGTTGEGKRIEAVQIKLMGSYASRYDIYYRAHITEAGWLGWTKNGNTAGSTGYAKQMEALEVKLVKKGTVIKETALAEAKMPAVKYRGHVANVGWKGWVSAGQTAGTTNEARQMEAVIIEMKDFHGKSGIKYMAHVANEGWQNWVTSGQTAGTTGKSRAIEAMRIQLTGYMDKFFDVYYRLHVKDHGWLGWAKNGEIAGTTGGGTRAEAIQVKVVVKDSAFDRGGAAYIDKATKSEANRAIARVAALVQTQVGDAQKGNRGQCMGLMVEYCSNILGLSDWPHVGTAANLADLSTYVPSGLSRIQGAQPQKGDILIYTGGKAGAGHVAIYSSESETYHQNYANKPYVTKEGAYNSTSVTGTGNNRIVYWGVLRPNF